MTAREMERALHGLADNQVVQGQLLHRVEQVVAQNTEAIARNTETIARNSEVMGKLADGMALLQAAMKGLFDHMERFIRGLESNGHEHGTKEG